MKNLLLLALALLIVPSGCLSQKLTKQLGTLAGHTGIYEGNCMPSPGIEPCSPRLASLQIVVTTPSENYNQTKIVKIYTSDSDGNFSMDLPAGTYSLFIKDEDDFVCSRLQCEVDCICFPITIEWKNTTRVELYLDHATW